jgi:sugar O-acyltransferase (sialic acid O-acetyltransferase NeuD family)
MTFGVYIIFSGGHSKQCIDIFLDNNIPILGLFDNNRPVGPFYRGTTILGKIEDILTKCNKSNMFFCACGNNTLRQSIVEKYPDLTWTNCISRHSIISPSATIGKGNYIGVSTKIAADAIIGDFNILNDGCTVTHDNVIGSYNHIAPNASLGGFVKIGNNCLIGTNATINPSVTMTDNIIIGSGAVALRSIEEAGSYVGIPCRNILSDKIETGVIL